MPALPLRRRLLVSFATLVAVGLLGSALWFGVLTSSASRELGQVARTWHGWLHPDGPAEAATLSATLTFDRADGLPDTLDGRSATLAFRCPDKITIETEVDGNAYAIGRDGGDVWFHVPHQAMLVVGSNDVPRFRSNPGSIEPVELPAVRFPIDRFRLSLLPALVEAEPARDAGGGGRSVGFRFRDFAVEWFGLPTHRFAVTFDAETHAPARLEVADGAGLDVAVRLTGGAADHGQREWTPEPAAGGPAERVALAHLKRFVEVTLENLDSRIEPLPPARGARAVVARSGAGRLEDWDGVRVLYLNGTPEEMGRQHGELLGDEIRRVVDRILYGVGVGSTFSKGRWFFGEIEEAVSRFGPFVDERYLREMDALAAAAGLEPEEVRLANFFPELFHCSGFALHGSATADGALYHGRVLDYLRGAGLEENAVVMVVDPEEGNAWANVSYAGFIGSVTAMNEKGVAIGEMGGGGEGDWDGKPMAQLMREVMERADTIDEAVEIMRRGPRTCEYYYVISDGKDGRAVGIAATPDIFETVWSGEAHPKLPHPVPDTVLLSSGDRYEELVRRVKAGHGSFGPDSARALMTRPVCMNSNIQSVLFAPGTLDYWVANADSENVASHTRYTRFNLAQQLGANAGTPVAKLEPQEPRQ